MSESEIMVWHGGLDVLSRGLGGRPIFKRMLTWCLPVPFTVLRSVLMVQKPQCVRQTC